MYHSFDIYHVILILTSLIYISNKKILECINVKLNDKITNTLLL